MLRKFSLSILILVLAFSSGMMLSGTQVNAQDDAVEEYIEDDAFTFDEDESSFDDSYFEESTLDDYNYDYEYSTTEELTEEEAAAILSAFAGFGVVFFGGIACLVLAIYIYGSLSLSTIGKKLGVGDTWMAWVPIANFFYMVKLAELDMWMGLLFFVPIVNLGISIYVWMKIAERRGFESWMGLLLLVPVINIFIPGYIAWATGSEPEADLSPM